MRVKFAHTFVALCAGICCHSTQLVWYSFLLSAASRQEISRIHLWHRFLTADIVAATGAACVGTTATAVGATATGHAAVGAAVASMCSTGTTTESTVAVASICCLAVASDYVVAIDGKERLVGLLTFRNYSI